MSATLSKSQRLQCVTLSLIPPVGQMLEDSSLVLSPAHNKTWGRIETIVGELLGTMPRYGEKAYRRLCKAVNMVWNSQQNARYDAIAMLYTALWLVEEVRMGQRLSAAKNRRRIATTNPQWTVLAGNLFSFATVLGDEWVDPNSKQNIQADELATKLVKFL